MERDPELGSGRRSSDPQVRPTTGKPAATAAVSPKRWCDVRCPTDESNPADLGDGAARQRAEGEARNVRGRGSRCRRIPGGSVAERALRFAGGKKSVDGTCWPSRTRHRWRPRRCRLPLDGGSRPTSRGDRRRDRLVATQSRGSAEEKRQSTRRPNANANQSKFRRPPAAGVDDGAGASLVGCRRTLEPTFQSSLRLGLQRPHDHLLYLRIRHRPRPDGPRVIQQPIRRCSANRLRHFVTVRRLTPHRSAIS